jgi:hypothetical protein
MNYPDTVTSGDLDALVYLMLKLRGPGLVDPALPVDPDVERYPAGLRDWAADRLAELEEERDRRRASSPAGVATIVTDDD